MNFLLIRFRSFLVNNQKFLCKQLFIWRIDWSTRLANNNCWRFHFIFTLEHKCFRDSRINWLSIHVLRTYIALFHFKQLFVPVRRDEIINWMRTHSLKSNRIVKDPKNKRNNSKYMNTFTDNGKREKWHKKMAMKNNRNG